MDPTRLHAHPNALAPHYSRFRVAERLLLTGHSHQAWPDRALAGQVAALEDAARLMDAKWERALERADRVRRGFASMLDDPTGQYGLGSNTHELVVRLLSALPLRQRPRVVTSDGEFHSLRRQLRRLEEEGLEVIWVPATSSETLAERLAGEVDGRTCAVATSSETLAERLAGEVDGRTCAVMVSSVLYRSGQMVNGLGGLAAACRREGVALLVDAYHSVNVAPLSVRRQGLEQAFVVGGGYKYCQLGEGNCFLRFPAGCTLRPAVTGWFAETAPLESPGSSEAVSYGSGGQRFAGSTYDPTSHYRAAEVMDFFEEQGLTPRLLRRVSQHQVGLLMRLFDDLDLPSGLLDRDRAASIEHTAGFLALTSPLAAQLDKELRRRGVRADHRGNVLRLGPAPYLSDRQLRDAMGIIGEAARSMEK